jgi:hypothetical protein
VICKASRGLHRTPDCVLATALGTLALVGTGALQLFGCHPAEVTNGRMDSYLSEVQGSLPAFSNQRRRNGQSVRPPETDGPADGSRMRLPKLWAQRPLPANRPVVPRLKARRASFSQRNESLKLFASAHLTTHRGATTRIFPWHQFLLKNALPFREITRSRVSSVRMQRSPCFPFVFHIGPRSRLLQTSNRPQQRPRSLGSSGNSPKTNHDDKTNFPLMGFHCILLE